MEIFLMSRMIAELIDNREYEYPVWDKRGVDVHKHALPRARYRNGDISASAEGTEIIRMYVFRESIRVSQILSNC
jgi:hypothetical protein